MSRSAWNHLGGSDEYWFNSMHDFKNESDQEPTWCQNSHWNVVSFQAVFKQTLVAWMLL